MWLKKDTLVSSLTSHTCTWGKYLFILENNLVDVCIHATLLYTQRSRRNNTQKFYFPKAMQLQAVVVCGVSCRAFWSITVSYPTSFTKQRGPCQHSALLGVLMECAYIVLLLQASSWILVSVIPPRHLSPKYSVITSRNKIWENVSASLYNQELWLGGNQEVLEDQFFQIPFCGWNFKWNVLLLLKGKKWCQFYTWKSVPPFPNFH